MDERVRQLLEEYYKLFPNEQLFPEWFDISNREKIEMLNEAIKDKKDLSQTRIFDKYQEKVTDDEYKEKYDNIEKALNKAHELLNDKSLCILKYAETADYYLFEYGTKDRKPLFDDCLIKVDRTNFVASYYKIVGHLDEINKLVFIDIK